MASYVRQRLAEIRANPALRWRHGIVECRAEGTWHYYSCKSEDAKAVIRLLDDLARNDMLPGAASNPLG
jgi:hypothetical protein